MDKERYLVNGKPLSWLGEFDLSKDEADGLSQIYGRFVFKLARLIRKEATDFPSDCLLVGDDWFQLTRFNPPYSVEGMDIYDPPDDAVFGVYPIQPRDLRVDRLGVVTLDSPVEDLIANASQAIEEGHSEDRRILEKIAVFDFSREGFPVFSPHRTLIPIPQEYWWGQRKLLGLTPPRTTIYHVIDFFPQKTFE